MNRKLILLNIVLLVLAGWFSWQLRLKWVELHQHEHTVLALNRRRVKKRLSSAGAAADVQADGGDGL